MKYGGERGVLWGGSVHEGTVMVTRDVWLESEGLQPFNLCVQRRGEINSEEFRCGSYEATNQKLQDLGISSIPREIWEKIFRKTERIIQS